MMRFTRPARRWFAVGLFLGASLSCGPALAGDHFHRNGQLVAVTTAPAPAQAVSAPIYCVPVVQTVPVQLGYIQTVQAGAVYLSAPTQGAAVTTAQAPVINIKLEAPAAPTTTAPVPQSASPTAQAPPITYAKSGMTTAPTYAVANFLVSQQAVPMQLYVVSKDRPGFFKHRLFFKSK
jgi:hypothetical protein